VPEVYIPATATREVGHDDDGVDNVLSERTEQGKVSPKSSFKVKFVSVISDQLER